MAADPAFAATVKHVAKSYATADTARTANPTNAVTLVTAGASGTKITEVTVVASASVATASMIRLWVHDGSNYFLYDELPVPVNTITASVPGWKVVRRYEQFSIQNGYTLRATIDNATVLYWFNVECADY